MSNMTEKGLSALLSPAVYECGCGRIHKTDLRWLRIERGALEALADMLAALNSKHPFIVCDENTWRAAGARADAILTEKGIPHGLFRFEEHKQLLPGESELGSICMNFDPECDLILGVGGGVINDLCKMAGRMTHIPTAIIATAPSMDGFASNSAAMEVSGVKKTIYTPIPTAVLCDTEILSQAPKRMLLAGVGDMIAKYISLCDWRISHIVTGEYFCEDVASLMRDALKKVRANIGGVLAGDPEAAGAVAGGLVLSGIAMSFAQVSRPASGLEHCVSHIWEMMALERGKPHDLHGIQVGIGTMMALDIYDEIRKLKPDIRQAKAAADAFVETEWEENLRRVFGSAAAPMIAEARKTKRNDPALRLERAARIIDRWDEILQVIREELPDAESLKNEMRSIGLPMRSTDIGISKEDAMDALRCSRDIRDRYLSSSMLWDIGALDEVLSKEAERL